MSRPLAVDADLALTHDGEEITVWDNDEVLVVDAPSFSAARALLRSITTSPTPIPLAELFDTAGSAEKSEAVDPAAADSDAADANAADADAADADAADADAADGTDTADANVDDLVAVDSPIDAEVPRDVDTILQRHDLTVEIRVRFATVACLGAGASPSGWQRRLAARVLGVPAAVSIRGIVVAAARRVG